MSALGEKDDDFFDFSEQILGESRSEESNEQPKEKGMLTYDSEVQTSYLLVNALLALLMQKGIIYPHEINGIVAELHEQYVRKKRGPK